MHEIEATAVDSPSTYVANQAQEYVRTNGQQVEHPAADRLILLYVKGRTSGLIRRVPLVALEEDGDLYIVGSKGGAPQHPEWYLNLEADSDVWVRNKADFYAAKATTLEGDERQAAWSKIVVESPFFDDYTTKTDRVLPVVKLTRAS